MSDGEDPEDDDERPDVEDLLPPEDAVPTDGEGDVPLEGDGEPVDALSGDGEAPDVDAPLDDLAEAARSRQQEGDDDLMDAFDEDAFDEVDHDALWEQLRDERIGATVEEPLGDAERDVRVVSKRDYCMRCQYFSAPPDVRCNHERGEILEIVDSEQFEVADCPILRGEEELENLRR